MPEAEEECEFSFKKDLSQDLVHQTRRAKWVLIRRCLATSRESWQTELRLKKIVCLFFSCHMVIGKSVDDVGEHRGRPELWGQAREHLGYQDTGGR